MGEKVGPKTPLGANNNYFSRVLKIRVLTIRVVIKTVLSLSVKILTVLTDDALTIFDDTELGVSFLANQKKGRAFFDSLNIKSMRKIRVR